MTHINKWKAFADKQTDTRHKAHQLGYSLCMLRRGERRFYLETKAAGIDGVNRPNCKASKAPKEKCAELFRFVDAATLVREHLKPLCYSLHGGDKYKPKDGSRVYITYGQGLRKEELEEHARLRNCLMGGGIVCGKSTKNLGYSNIEGTSGHTGFVGLVGTAARRARAGFGLRKNKDREMSLWEKQHAESNFEDKGTTYAKHIRTWEKRAKQEKSAIRKAIRLATTMCYLKRNIRDIKQRAQLLGEGRKSDCFDGLIDNVDPRLFLPQFVPSSRPLPTLVNPNSERCQETMKTIVLSAKVAPLLRLACDALFPDVTVPDIRTVRMRDWTPEQTGLQHCYSGRGVTCGL